MPDKTIELRLGYEREHKNSIRFSEEAPDGDIVIGKLYLKKAKYEKLGKPQKLTMTITAEGE